MSVKTPIYLDYAAATPLGDDVLAVMKPYFSKWFYNPSALYLAAKDVRMAMDQARHNVAQIMGARPGEIIFTAGATEANNIAIHGVMRQYPDAHCLVSALEHESVIKPIAEYSHTVIPSDERGIIQPDSVLGLINAKTVLISIMHVNNEIGSVQRIADIVKIIEQIRAERTKAKNNLPLYLHTDAAQSGNYFDLHIKRLGVDMLSVNGGKLYGPKQSGVLYVRRGIVLKPWMIGGGQEFGLRSGTENVPGVIGLTAALHTAQQTRVEEAKRLTALRDGFIKKVLGSVPGSRLNGSSSYRSPNNAHFTFDGIDNEWLVMSLDEAGIMCAAGSACSASTELPSHVLMAIGLSEREAQSSIRVSMGRTTTVEQLDFVAAELGRLVNSKR